MSKKESRKRKEKRKEARQKGSEAIEGKVNCEEEGKKYFQVLKVRKVPKLLN